MGLPAISIRWTKLARGEEPCGDGYSLHLDESYASMYLRNVYDVLPDGGLPDAFSYPDQGWSVPVRVQPVMMPESIELAFELKQQRNLRIFPAFQNMAARRYAGVSTLPNMGEPKLVSFRGQIIRSAQELAALLPQGSEVDRRMAAFWRAPVPAACG